MIAVDTNVIVRLLTGDDAKQSARAKALFEREEILLPKTVLLETDWVLRRLYAFPAKEVASALLGLISLPNIQGEDASVVAIALGWVQKGMDFADDLHLASSGKAEKFATFDAKFAKQATKHSGLAVVSP
mgnify:CR=1 FL=1